MIAELTLAVCVVGGLAACGAARPDDRPDDLPADAACRLLTDADLAATLGGAARAGRPTTSDGGPDGVVGCNWLVTSGAAQAAVTVWLLHREAATMYAEQSAAPYEHRPVDVPGGTGFVVGAGGESVFVLRDGVYLNVDVTSQSGTVPAGAARSLTDLALPRLP